MRDQHYFYIFCCGLLFLFLKIELKVKFYFLLLLIIFASIFLASNKNIYNRVIDQTIYEIFGKSTKQLSYYNSDEIIVENYHKKIAD